MIPAISYVRVSTKDQEAEGFSVPAQQKLVQEYARRNGFNILREFEEAETAKKTGRKQFGAMMQFLIQNKCRTIIVEKTDRLYRNFGDCVALDQLGVEIHLAKEGRIIGKNSRSQDKLLHGIQLVIAANFTDNLKEEVRKGMREKAEQGFIPAGRRWATATTGQIAPSKFIPPMQQSLPRYLSCTRRNSIRCQNYETPSAR